MYYPLFLIDQYQPVLRINECINEQLFIESIEGNTPRI